MAPAAPASAAAPDAAASPGTGDGAAIRTRRTAAGASQMTLAIRARCAVNTVRFLEAGGTCTAFTQRKVGDALTALETEAKAA